MDPQSRRHGDDNPMDPAEFRAFTLTLDDATRLCAACGLPQPTSIERIPKGEVRASFRLEVEGRGRAVLKVDCRYHNPAPLRLEHAVETYLQRHSELPVPTWCVLDITERAVPYPCRITAWLPGVDGDELAEGLAEPERELLMRRCGEVLARLHRVPLDGAAELIEAGVVVAEQWAAREDEAFGNALWRLRRQGWIDPQLLTAAEQTWEAGQNVLAAPFQPALLHRDFQLWNLRCDPATREVVGLMDLDAAVLGPPSSDARDLELNLFLEQPKLRRAFWAGYGHPGPGEQELDRLRLAAVSRALSILAAYWGPTGNVDAAKVWRLLSPWDDESDELPRG